MYHMCTAIHPHSSISILNYSALTHEQAVDENEPLKGVVSVPLGTGSQDTHNTDSTCYQYTWYPASLLGSTQEGTKCLPLPRMCVPVYCSVGNSTNMTFSTDVYCTRYQLLILERKSLGDEIVQPSAVRAESVFDLVD